jgi:SpoVK/Ycf46/Vps4 family AAA+-type ATPase
LEITQTSDTVKFWKSHKKDILQMAKDVSSDLGENLIEMIGGFNCLKYYDYDNEKWTDKEGQEAIMHTIYGRKTDDIVANAMSWFAAEEVCQMFE